MGKGLDSDCDQTAAQDPPEPAALEDQNRGLFPSHGEYLVPADDRALFPAAARNDRQIQSGLVPDALHRPAAVAGVDRIRLDFLFNFTKGTLSGLETPAKVPAFPDVGRNRPVRQ